MSFILYGGPKEVVEKQLKCEHKWYGPCMDVINRFNKCTECFCIEYDCTWETFLEISKDLEIKREEI